MKDSILESFNRERFDKDYELPANHFNYRTY